MTFRVTIKRLNSILRGTSDSTVYVLVGQYRNAKRGIPEPFVPFDPIRSRMASPSISNEKLDFKVLFH